MNIKNFLILSVIFLFACGGGSSGTSAGASSSGAASASNSGNITDQLQIVE